jgi:hypothetical protein
LETRIVTRPLETCPAPRRPLMVTVAVACFLIDSQRALAGNQVCADACFAVNRGGSFVSAVQSGSIAPIRIRGPADVIRTGGAHLKKRSRYATA